MQGVEVGGFGNEVIGMFSRCVLGFRWVLVSSLCVESFVVVFCGFEFLSVYVLYEVCVCGDCVFWYYQVFFIFVV